jgi:hypothetical protein
MGSRTQKSPRDWLILVVLTALGLGLRVAGIGKEALWTDEALTYVIAQVPIVTLATAPIDPTPIFYYWLHQLLVPEGAGAIAGRSISLVAGVLTIPAAYLLGWSIAGRIGATFAGAWTAVAAPLVEYSQEARAYAVLVLLILLSALALQGAVRTTGNRRRLALTSFVITTLLAIYTHFVAFFWAGPAWLILRGAAERSSDRRNVRDAWITAIALFVGAAPEVLRTFRYAREATGFMWLQQPDVAGFASLILGQWLPMGAMVAGTATLLVLLFLAVRERSVLADWAARDPVGALILAALLVQPLALWAFGFLAQPVLMARTMLPSIPAVGLLIALLLVPLRPRLRLILGVIILAGALTATLSRQAVLQKEDWNGAARFLAHTSPSRGEIIVACPNWKAPALMAAMAGTGAAPIATGFGGQMRLLEGSSSHRSDWATNYFRNLYVLQHHRAMGLGRPVEHRATRPVSIVWLVESECTDAERAELLAWAGSVQKVARWSAPATKNHAGIVIEGWKRQALADLPVTAGRSQYEVAPAQPE